MEQFEPRQLLASDIGLTDFGATGTHLVVAYDIADETAPAFNVSVYRSADGVTRDALVGTREVTFDQDRTVGSHAVGVGVDLDDLREDYRLIAVVDLLNEVAEASEANNEIAFRGGGFLTPDGTLHVHGGDSAETVKIEVAEPADGSGGVTGSANGITVKIDEWTMDYDADTLREIHLRLHGGDDVLNVQPQVAHNIQIHSGAGNDRMLSGAGSDWLIGGAGNDFIAGRGNRDLIDGSEGDDTLTGGGDQDTLVGWHGNDKLIGGAGRDITAGGDGQDIVDGGADDDQVFGGRGADRIVNPPGREEARDRKSEDTLLTTTPEELIFAELSAEDESDSLQIASLESASLETASSMEAYGYAGSAGPFWLEPIYWATAPHYQPEGNEYLFTPFAINREDTWGPLIDFEVTYYGTVTLGDFHSLQTSLVMDDYEENVAAVKDDDILEGTESFIAYIANAYGANGEMIIIDYPSTGQPASDFDGDPWSETAYIIDGDLELYDSNYYPVSEADEESPGVFMQVGNLHPLVVGRFDDPTGSLKLIYPSGLAVWRNDDRLELIPSGSEIEASEMVYIEALAPVSNAVVSFESDYYWNAGVLDRIVMSTIPIEQVTSIVPDVPVPFGDNGPGMYFLPYSDSAGELVAVNIMPPEALESYAIGLDFWGTVDTLTGDVDLQFIRPGEYVVEVVRKDPQGIETKSWFEVAYKSSKNDKISPNTPAAELGRYEIPKPTADLVLISDGPEGPSTALRNARQFFGYDYESISSVADAIAEIDAYAQAHPGQKFTVMIIDHGSPAEMSIGNGIQTTPGKYIDDSNDTKADRDALVAACKGRVSQLTLAGCTVGGRINPRDPASLDVGGAFRQRAHSRLASSPADLA